VPLSTALDDQDRQASGSERDSDGTIEDPRHSWTSRRADDELKTITMISNAGKFQSCQASKKFRPLPKRFEGADSGAAVSLIDRSGGVARAQKWVESSRSGGLNPVSAEGTTILSGGQDRRESSFHITNITWVFRSLGCAGCVVESRGASSRRWAAPRPLRKDRWSRSPVRSLIKGPQG